MCICSPPPPVFSEAWQNADALPAPLSDTIVRQLLSICLDLLQTGQQPVVVPSVAHLLSQLLCHQVRPPRPVEKETPAGEQGDSGADTDPVLSPVPLGVSLHTLDVWVAVLSLLGVGM